jgi:hypothetical protein
MEQTKRGRKNVLGNDVQKILVAVPADSYNRFKDDCKAKNKPMSEAVRELIVNYLQTTVI